MALRQLQLLRTSAPLAAQAVCSRPWVSVRPLRGLAAGRHGLTAGISTTCPALKRPRAAVVTYASSQAGEAETQAGTVALGKVMAAQANFVRVKVESLEGPGAAAAPPPRARLLCVVRGLLKKIKQSVLVGDSVRVVGIDWTDGRGMVEEVLPRRSELSDPAVANVDHVVLVFAAEMPPFQPAQVTRYLVSAEAAGLPVTLLINKADLVPEEELRRIVEQVASWGYAALPVSVVSGDGLPALAERLQQRVSVVAGPSGAGKSSIINALRLRSAGLDGSLEAMRAEPTRSSAGSGGESLQNGLQAGSGGDDESESEVGPAGSGSSGAAGSSHEARQAANSSSSSSSGAAAADDALEHSRETSSSCVATAAVTAAAQQGQQQQQQPPQSEAWPELGLPELQGLELEGLELQAVGDVSQRIGRGKHTTRNITLLDLGEGALLADTPGFNQPVLGMPAAELGAAFPEVRARLQESRCAFSNCQHLAEPGCAVRGDWERYAYYCDLHAELTQQEEVERERASSKKKREGTVRFKSRAGGRQGAEARLETKTHRRVSRRSVKQGLSEMAKGQLDEEGDEY